MHRMATAARAVVWLALVAPSAHALTLDRALSLAKERGPAVLAARVRIAEARGQLAGASVLLRENPVVEGAAGERHGDDGRSFSAELGVSQTFEIAGQRGARVEGAEAFVAGASASADDSARKLLEAVAVAFYRLLHAEQRRDLAEHAEGLASEIARIAERRHRADEVPVLDQNLGRAALARASAERMGAEAELVAAQGELRILLGMAEADPLTAEGDLRTTALDRSALVSRLDARPDLRRRAAQLEQAEAQHRLAQREAWPDVGLGARYEREEGDDSALGVVSLAIPLFDREQGRRAETKARVRRLRLELDAARSAAVVELETAIAVHARRLAAVEEFEARALPLLDENESLARRSYEAGEMGLADLLLVRHETLDARREHLDRLREAALAAVAARASAGVIE